MVVVDTFLTTLYVMVDDFCLRSLPPEPHPGPQAALSRSEGMTLALCGQWQGFGSERGFYRFYQWSWLPKVMLYTLSRELCTTTFPKRVPGWERTEPAAH
jgi:hypothetical protein